MICIRTCHEVLELRFSTVILYSVLRPGGLPLRWPPPSRCPPPPPLKSRPPRLKSRPPKNKFENERKTNVHGGSKIRKNKISSN